MITKIRFREFKALKDAELKLGWFNIIVGPNGSGKSTVLQGLELLSRPEAIDYGKAINLGSVQKELSIIATLKDEIGVEQGGVSVPGPGRYSFVAGNENDAMLMPEPAFQDLKKRMSTGVPEELARQVSMRQHEAMLRHAPTRAQSEATSKLKSYFQRIKIFSIESSGLGQAVDSRSVMELQKDGKNLAGALTNLRDKDEDAYDHLREEFQRWIPEYDSIGFENDQNGYRQVKLRQRSTKQFIPASQASEGTLLALALLTIVYQPTSPIFIGLEEPDRGLHPRLLRDVRDALYRLSFPTDFGIKRSPVQVIATTHSPFFLDLFKDHPEQVIIAEKKADGSATFKNLSEDPKLRDLIGDASLGEIWYSGILGGVPEPA
jgi:predicted ATPase